MSIPRQRSTMTLATILGSLALVLAAGTTLQAEEARPAAKLEIRPGDHICIIGNTLADRMQHDGWLETLLQYRFPKHELVIRNLGFSGDTLTLRLRSSDFGTPDQWLAGSAPVPQPGKLVTRHGVRENRFETTNTRADVVFAFFGYNESFAGKEGLDPFKKDLDAFIKHTLDQRYNGKSAPRLVLFSPIAHEDLRSRNLPDGHENNQRLQLYTAAMAEVSQANHVPFVDLFRPTRELYAKAKQPLTINGIHLNADGNREVAAVIDHELFGPAPKQESQGLEKLRQAVLDKNFYWFNRYRVLDGYNIYGGRAFEKYADRQSNYEDQQRELEILDVMTANRDKRIWAVAQGTPPTPPSKGGDKKGYPPLEGGDKKGSRPYEGGAGGVDDSNTPPFIPVKTNKPGEGPHGEHIFLDGQEAIKQMTVARGMKVNLFASEKEFPELAKPVQMSWDTRGRLWVAVWPSYPHWKPKEEMNDKILIFEDTKGTGKADKCIVFADHLHCPTGFEFYNGGVLVAQAPDVIFLKDTKGNDKADLRVRVLHGIDSADTHHTANSFALDPGGALYFQEGTFHHTQVETPYGPPVRNVNAGVYRYEPRTQKFEVYVPYGFANPHGHVWGRWGQDYVTDGTGANPYHGALFSGHLDYPQKHGHPPQLYQQRTRPCPGIEVLSSQHFPEENQGNLLVANVIGFQGILQYKIADAGSSFAGTEVEPILYSSDPNFRPSDIKIGPDGAIYFLDWQNPIIGHLQHALRDPSRDRTHGRIYRVTREGQPLLTPVKIAGEPIEKLLDLLKEPEDRVRYRVRIELGGRDSDQVIAAVKKWVDGLDRNDPQYEHHLLEALWVHQSQNVVNADLLKRVLTSPEFRARAAATRVLCYWRDRVPEALALLKKLAADSHPRVRLEAVRAASFFTAPEALEVALISTEQPTDPYLDYVRGETIKALEPYVKKAIADKRPIQFTSAAGARFFLKNVSTEDLLKMQRNEAVDLELLFRKGMRDEQRQEALAGLAKLRNKSELRVLLDAIRKQDSEAGGRRPGAAGQGAVEESLIFDLARLLTSRKAKELNEVRADLEQLATSANLPVIRQLGFVALAAADGNTDKIWQLGTKSVSALLDLVHAMPLLRDPSQRASLYPKVEPLLHGLPKELTVSPESRKAVFGRYVRIELPGKKKTLTLAEVEVYSDGRNVARQGRAKQKNTAFGGDASKAIDGNKSGAFSDGGTTHTEENTSSPWWEVDLGRELPIASVVVYNRTDPGHANQLDGFTLKVLDKDHKVVFQQPKLAAPSGHALYEVGGEAPERLLRRAAMLALPSVRGQETETFKALAQFLSDDADRHVAIQGLERIPARYWPKEEAKPLLDDLLAYVRSVPIRERTSEEVLGALQLADALAALLPLTEARQFRKEVGELGVRVVRVGTVPDQMLFDKERLVVQAGKPVEIRFENTDLMPHNFVITRPGALAEVGELGEVQGTAPDAAKRNYVPRSNKILLSSRLVQPRDAQKLSFTAPSQPGVYPYVCTYPGHWRRMYGALYVVADVDAYLADPQGYLAQHPVPIADELLKLNRPRTEWKFEDLAPVVAQMDHGRSFSNGKAMFQVANCVACHKMGGVGNEIGPDLTKLDPKLTPVDHWRDIVEPSFRINEKYYTYVFETQSGKVVTGLILEETPEVVKVIENPLVKSQAVVLKRSEIVSREKSPTSIMPKGLVDKLTREEILDLVAYVSARGDEHHPLFQGGHDHGHVGH